MFTSHLSHGETSERQVTSVSIASHSQAEINKPGTS